MVSGEMLARLQPVNKPSRRTEGGRNSLLCRVVQGSNPKTMGTSYELDATAMQACICQLLVSPLLMMQLLLWTGSNSHSIVYNI
eukprot:1143980-Pelagomonas_calceolata.AAC.4